MYSYRIQAEHMIQEIQKHNPVEDVCNTPVYIYIFTIADNIMQYAIITSDLSSMHDIELYHNM